MHRQGAISAAGAGDNAPAEMQACEISGCRASKPSKATSMKVLQFSSATWANDADFEAAAENQHQKVFAVH